MFKVNTDSYIVYYRNIKSIDFDLFSSVISEYILIYNIDISYFNYFCSFKKTKYIPHPSSPVMC